ncbi:hypothetical protein Pla110_45070 [Polystyrenella longa]|uniref:Uncharacterized protein n=1 Tax=Polystyrenella longa TaxID=2528007 RepID=A0A518CU53_9PLAN|nr:hypothetical protein Pla110_45070 [Polystyrenella longa]
MEKLCLLQSFSVENLEGKAMMRIEIKFSNDHYVSLKRVRQRVKTDSASWTC